MNDHSANKLCLVLLVSGLVSLEDLLHGAEDSHESVSVDADYSSGGQGLDAGLPVDVVDKGKFSEVVSFFVLVDNLFFSVFESLLGD